MWSNSYINVINKIKILKFNSSRNIEFFYNFYITIIEIIEEKKTDKSQKQLSRNNGNLRIACYFSTMCPRCL